MFRCLPSIFASLCGKISRLTAVFSERLTIKCQLRWRGNLRELEHVIERAFCCVTAADKRDEHPKFSSAVSFADLRKNEGKISIQESVNSTGNGNGTTLNGNLGGEDMFNAVGKFIVEHLPEPKDGEDQDDVFNSIESSVVLAALKRTKGNKQAAANLLGLYRPRLYGMIKRHNIDDKLNN